MPIITNAHWNRRTFVFNQLNNFVDSIFGSLAWIVGEGGVAGLYFAYRLILFPLGIFSNSLSQVLLPEFSTQALEDNYEKLRHSLSFGLRATFFVVLPASSAFIVLAWPIISTIFGGGRFDSYSARVTAGVLSFYSIGLCAYAVTRILQASLFALKDTVTPTKTASLAFVLNIVFNFLLMFPLKLSGIALATSISGIISCLVLFFALKKRISLNNPKIIYFSFLRILAASICMGIICFVISQREIFPAQGRVFLKFINLGFIIFIGLLSYIGMIFGIAFTRC